MDISAGSWDRFPRPSCVGSGCGKPSDRLTAPRVAPTGTGGIRAELRLGLGIAISRKTVKNLMGEEGLAGLPVRRHRKNLVNVATFEDLVQRRFTRDAPNQLWVTDITEHPTREGKVYCCVVLQHQPHRPLPQLLRVLGRPCHTSTLSTNGVSTFPPAVH